MRRSVEMLWRWFKASNGWTKRSTFAPGSALTSNLSIKKSMCGSSSATVICKCLGTFCQDGPDLGDAIWGMGPRETYLSAPDTLGKYPGLTLEKAEPLRD